MWLVKKTQVKRCHLTHTILRGTELSGSGPLSPWEWLVPPRMYSFTGAVQVCAGWAGGTVGKHEARQAGELV